MNASHLKKDANKLLRISKSMSVGDCVTAISAHTNKLLDKHKLPHVLVPERRWKGSPGKATAAPIVTALHPSEFRTAVRDCVEDERTNGPSKAVPNMKRLKAEWHIFKKYESVRNEAGCEEASRKAASNGLARRVTISKGVVPCRGGCLKIYHEGDC